MESDRTPGPGSVRFASTSFVGRQREFEILRIKLDEASTGRGSLAMLVGEAGIGKTWIAREFAEECRKKGCVVLWGCCFEGDWQPPYGPFVEALGDYVRASEPEQLRQLLGSSAAALAEILPEVRAILPDTPAATRLSPDEERVRLYDAVIQLILSVARESPVVLFLDDLHWADRDSLRLLRHLARFVGRGRVLVIGVCRDTELEVKQRHPLADLLAVLRREVDYQHIVVHGLSYAEVSEYLARVSGLALPYAMVQIIYAGTSGNPFFVRELFRHLTEEGKILRRAGRWSTDFSIRDLGIPIGVRQVLHRRLSHLSEETNDVLRFAAGFVGGFTFGLLQVLTDLSDDALLNSLDEALRAGLLQVVEGPHPRYDFAHAVVRQTLYDELNPDRRARLHRQIAFALEEVYAKSELEHAAELAVQYHSSASLPGGNKGIRYALAAAGQARAARAHERAVAFLRMARDLSADAEPDVRADVLRKLAVAEAEAMMFEEARHSAEEALATLVENGAAAKEQAEVLAATASAVKEGGGSPSIWEPLVERGLRLLGEEHDILWARLMLLRDPFEAVAGGMVNVGRWLGFDREAVALARASGDEDDYTRTMEPYDWQSREEAERVLALARTWQRPTAIMRVLGLVARDLFYRHSAVREAAELYEELLASSQRYGSIPGQAEALTQLAIIQVVRGDLPLAEQMAQRAREMIARLGPAHGLHFMEVGLASILAYYLDGDWPALAAAAAEFAASPEAIRTPAGMGAAAVAALDHSRAENAAEARMLLSALTPMVVGIEPTTFGHNLVVNIAACAAWNLGAAEFADIYRQAALGMIEAGIGDSLIGPLELAVARMAVLRGDAAEAAEYFARARAKLDGHGRQHLRAIVDYDEALALIRMGAADRTHARDLLAAALTTFRELNMEGWAKRALDQQAMLLGARRGGSPAERARLDGLTAREIEVLRLLASGCTSKEIATELVLSVATVNRHIANIYQKIGARGRAEAIGYALRHGIDQASS